ncbi:uncharacterized protein [Periplaneta americana]|uniref:uncharacterized protein isoform X1 n=1 Tax=Periplaneta americana TaxID=6978 RepID=UPI0037E7C82E
MESNNEVTKPEWMSTSFFESALRFSEEDNNITVISSEVKAATVPGDNYVSDMYRAVVKFKRGSDTVEKSIIVKASKPTSEGVMAKITSETNIFYQETAAFTMIFPEMYNLLNEVPSLSNQPFSAKYLYSYHSNESTSSILLEDLKVSGFRLAEKKSGLDLKHCLLVMRTIARFHAVSLVLHQKDPEIFKSFMVHALYTGKDTGMEAIITGGVSNAAREVETWPDFKEKFARKLYNLRDTAMEQWIAGIVRNENEFNVLCHGDLWFNNMMFRYSDDTGEVEEVRFVDFQLTYWTSPVMDLQYFMHSSASAEVLEHSEVLIQEYYSTLCEILTLLKHPHLQPTMSLINEELEKRSRFAVIASIAGRSVVLADKSKIPDMNNVVQEKETFQLTEEYKSSLKKLLILFEARGWL